MRPLLPLLAALTITGVLVPTAAKLNHGPRVGDFPPVPRRAAIEVPYLILGQTNVVQVHQAPSDVSATLYGTLAMGASRACLPELLGHCLDLPGPIARLVHHDTATTSAAGDASFTVTLPVRPPRSLLSLQVMGSGVDGWWVSNVAHPRLLSAQDDLDGDGLVNADEIALGTDPSDPDTDGDGLTDGDEVHVHGTLPGLADTDGGSVSDGDEILAGTLPLDPSDDVPVPPAAGDGIVSLDGLGTPSGTGFTLTWPTGTDTQRGSCQSSAPSGEVAIAFTAPTTGLWHLSTLGSSVDTTLSVRTDCSDSGSEQACSDDALPDTHGEVWLPLAQGQQVVALVERAAGLTPALVTLTADTAPPPGAATLTSVDAVCSDHLGLVAVGIEGSHPIVRAVVEAHDVAGTPLLWSDGLTHEVLIDAGDVQTLAPILTWTAAVPDLPPNTSQVTLRWADGLGVLSNAISATCVAPTPRTLGDACDRDGIFDVCGEGSCTTTQAGDVCVDAHAPSLLAVDARYRVDLRRLGLQLIGSDEELDVVGVELTLLDGGLQPLLRAGAPYPPLVAPVQSQGGGTMFLASTVATLPATAPTVGLEALSVVAIDAAGLRSPPLLTRLLAPESVGTGEACDVAETLSRCPVDEDCLAPIDDPTGDATCATADEACPALWSPGTLGAPVDTGDPAAWLWTGDLTNGTWWTPPGTCGGQGPQDVVSFTAPSSGWYRISVVPDALGATPALMVRTRCEAPTAARELTCATGTAARSGRLLQLAQGQTVHIVIAGTSPLTTDGSLGAYTLTVNPE